jgi:HAD superfamily hydrolase (TIGR01509 family)
MTAIAALFDMDGVLVDSAPLHVRAYEQVFGEAGIEFPEAARAAVGKGKSRMEVIEIGAPHASPAVKQRLFDAKPEAVAEALQDAGDVSRPGTTRTMEALAKSGIPMGVVTNSAAPHMWLEAAGVLDKVEVVVTSNDVSSPKPSPEGYLLAARQLGVEPERCIAFEDSHDGWLSATRAGMRVVVISRTRPAWIDADTEVVESFGASIALKQCLRAAAGDDA